MRSPLIVCKIYAQISYRRPDILDNIFFIVFVVHKTGSLISFDFFRVYITTRFDFTEKKKDTIYVYEKPKTMGN